MYVRELRLFSADVDRRIAPIDDRVAAHRRSFSVAAPPSLRATRSGRRLCQTRARRPLQLQQAHRSPFGLARAFVAQRIADSQRTGAAPALAPSAATADLLIRVAMSYALLPTDLADLANEREAREFAPAAIAPLAIG